MILPVLSLFHASPFHLVLSFSFKTPLLTGLPYEKGGFTKRESMGEKVKRILAGIPS